VQQCVGGVVVADGERQHDQIPPRDHGVVIEKRDSGRTGGPAGGTEGDGLSRVQPAGSEPALHFQGDLHLDYRGRDHQLIGSQANIGTIVK
jgi:hypothetical protein